MPFPLPLGELQGLLQEEIVVHREVEKGEIVIWSGETASEKCKSSFPPPPSLLPTPKTALHHPLKVIIYLAAACRQPL